MMKHFMDELGQWLRHKIRVIVMKQWKKPKTFYRNLCYLNRNHKNGFNNEAIFSKFKIRLVQKKWYECSEFHNLQRFTCK